MLGHVVVMQGAGENLPQFPHSQPLDLTQTLAGNHVAQIRGEQKLTCKRKMTVIVQK